MTEEAVLKLNAIKLHLKKVVSLKKTYLIPKVFSLGNPVR